MALWRPEVEAAPRAELIALQGRRLREQVAYVYEHSAFYRRKLDAAGVRPDEIASVEDLVRVPLTTKEELRRSQEAAPPFGEHVCATKRDIVWAPTTSGTTGVPLVLPRTAADIETWTELNARAFTCVGVGPDDVYQNILGYHWIFGGIALHDGARRVGATVINAGVGNTAKQMWALRYFGTTSFHATPSYLMHLGARLHESGSTADLEVRTIIAGGEVGMAGEAAKRRLAEVWPTVRTFADVGGVTDVGTMIWAECAEMQGGHLAEDSVICEVLDPATGQPVQPGEVGELVLTDLVSKGAPLLRYRVGDLTRVDISPCACGRSLARLPHGILGRSDDMFTVRATNIYPSAIDEAVKSIDRMPVSEYQVVVDRPDNLDVMTVHLEVPSSVPRAAVRAGVEQLEERLKFSFGLHAVVEVVAPGTLPAFTYKGMRIIDKRRGQTEQQAIDKAAEQARL